MRRREFIAATAVLLVSPRRSRAQGTRRRVGFLAMDVVEPTVQKAWLDGLRNHGWIDGRNLIIEYRYAQSQDRLPASAAELVALSPDLLIATSPQTAVALKSATATIPIVFAAVYDPVALGLVQSLSRPGGNVTGLAPYAPGADIRLFFHTALTREAARSRPARLKWSHLLNTSATTLRRYSLNILKELGKV